MGTNGIGKSYDEFLNSIKQRGMGTTSLGNGEANFSDYANALSANLQEELVASIGDEQGDAELQSRVARLFSGKSVMQSNDIINAAKAAGLQVSVEYKSTSYIVDNKQDGHYDKDVTNGSIAIYTFSDGNSTIKIADANGNGALEAEEIYLNEILSGVTNSLGAQGSTASTAQSGPSALDIQKMQQDILLAQIEESKKAQEETLKQMEDSREARQKEREEEDNIEIGKKENNDEEKETISKEKFENLVLKEALNSYSGYNHGSIKAIDKAIEELKGKYNLDFDISEIDSIALSEEYSKGIAQIDEENGEQDEQDKNEDTDKVDGHNFFEDDKLLKEEKEEL